MRQPSGRDHGSLSCLLASSASAWATTPAATTSSASGGASNSAACSRWDQRRVEIGFGKRTRVDDTAQEGHIGVQAGDVGVAQRRVQPRQRLRAVLAAHDQLGDHRVVVRADLVALAHAGIDAHRAALEAHMLGPARHMQGAGGGQEIGVRILGADARLDRMAVHRDLLLRQRQRLARGHAQLPLDQILAGDRLGHRVLHLQPRVHLHEVKAPILFSNELDRPRTHVADRLGRRHGGFAHLLAAFRRHARRGRFFQHLLVAALHRAIALVQVHAAAVAVAKHLDLDVARLLHITLDQHRVVAEAVDRLALAGGQRGLEILAPVDRSHALAAAAGAGLDQHRVADAVGLGFQQRKVLAGAVITRHQRYAGLLHQALRFGLQAHR
jgi:hypothetical protein